MTIDRENCVKSIVAWNRKKSWANYNAVRKFGYLNWNHIPAPIWAIYTHVKTIWNTLIGKYKRCERGLKENGQLDYYLKGREFSYQGGCHCLCQGARA